MRLTQLITTNLQDYLPNAQLRKAITTCVAVLCILLTFVGLTFAWSSMQQRAVNAIEGVGLAEDFSVELLKYEAPEAGGQASVRLPGAEFFLFRAGESGAPSTQVGGLFVTDSNGRIFVGDLAPGDYYFLEVRPPSGYTFMPDSSGNSIDRHPFTIVGDEDTDGDAATVGLRVYNMRLMGSLVIEKTVVNDDESALTDAQRALYFEFRLDFSDGGTYSFRINGLGPEIPHVSGETLVLRHGQRAVFESLPTGIMYTVVETPVPGFNITSNNHQGTITTDGSQAEFVNTWRTDLPVGSLRVTKDVVGIVSLTEFDFVAVIGGVEHPFNLAHGGEELFENIPVGTPFVVTETAVPGYTATILEFTGVIAAEGVVVHLPFVNVYDDDLDDEYGSLRISKMVPGGSDTEFSFVVVIGEDGGAGAVEHEFTLRSGEYELFIDIPHGTPFEVRELPEPGYIASIVTASGIIAGNVERRVDFVNHVAPVVPDVEITVLKTVEGDSPDPDTRFNFVLIVEGRENVYFDLSDGESESFTLPEGALFTVLEIDLAAGWSLIRVSSGHGTAAEGIVAEFVNRFDGEWTIDIPGTKTWEAAPGVALPESITLRLMDGQRVVRVLEVRAPTGGAGWDFVFEGVPKFDAQGREIVYTIEEAPISGWVPRYAEDSFDIVNVHVPPLTLEGDDAIAVRKALIGELEPEVDAVFRFALTAADDAPMPEGTNAQGQRIVTITGEGVTNFGPITFTHPGTFVYTIVEINTRSTYYIYDESVYELTIVIAEVDGELVVSSRTLTRDGRAVEDALDIVFENEYTDELQVLEGNVTVAGQKRWNHGTNPQANWPAQVTFFLYADGVLFKEFRVNAESHWRYSFELPKYNQDGSEIVWTVDEEAVAGYSKRIDGLDITNTHSSVGDPGNDTGNDNRTPGPVTGDDSNRLAWLAAMVLSGLAVFSIGVWQWRESRLRALKALSTTEKGTGASNKN